MNGRRALVLAMALAALAPAVTAHAAQTVSVLGYGPTYVQCPSHNYCWMPSTVTINTGDSVSFGTGTGTHALQRLSGPWPGGPCQDGTLPTCTFTQAGTYTFQCAYHTTLMQGSITVNGSAPPTSPAPTHSQAPAAPPPATHMAPAPATSQPAAAAPPSSPSPAVALAPSPSPSEAPSPSPSQTPAAVHTAPASAGGGGSPVPAILVVVALAVLGGAGFYWYRSRQPA